MKNKAPLSLMEQLIMLLVFALAAALCLQIYALSDQISRRSEARGHAATAVQNTAEAVKLCKGDASLYPQYLGGAGDAQQWQIGCDENWNAASPEQAGNRILVIPEPSFLPTLGRAVISARTETGEELFRVTVSWQEVAYE